MPHEDLDEVPLGRGEADGRLVAAAMTFLAARSTVNAVVRTTASSASGVAARRSDARTRASSSPIPKGLVT